MWLTERIGKSNKQKRSIQVELVHDVVFAAVSSAFCNQLSSMRFSC